MPRRTALSLLVSTALALGSAAAGAAQTGSPAAALARAQELIDNGRPEEALPLVERLASGGKPDPRALMLRGTARLMIGQAVEGRKDLERALSLDPGQRQGWLNLAGVHIAEKRYGEALTALEKAEQLDPQAPDNDLNLGAVLLLDGKLQPASERFARYLGRNASADGYYLVATNYALAGYNALAAQHMRQAIAINERSRLRVRTDPNFADLAGTAQFQEILRTDVWRPAAGALQAQQDYAVPYSGQGKLLDAVLAALQAVGEPFDPRVEVTDAWTLIWGEFRIKLSAGADGNGRVELFANPGQMTPAQWQQRSERLLREILLRLAH
jgi:tetratricopeptide (TPR) repeat protein